MKLKIPILSLLAVTALSLPTASAGIFVSTALLTWDTTGLQGVDPNPLPAATVDPNLMSGSTFNTLTRVGVVAAQAASPAYSDDNFFSTGWNTGAFDQSVKYLSFVVAPAAGFQLTLDSLDFNIIGTNTAPKMGRWGYSLDGGVTFVFGPEMTLVNNTHLSNSTWAFDAPIVTDQSVEFRFWSYGTDGGGDGIGAGSNAATGGGIRVGDGMTLNGSVSAVPEPATYMFLGLGLVGLGVIYSRSRRMKSDRIA